MVMRRLGRGNGAALSGPGKETYFEIHPKLYTREELAEIKNKEAFLKEEKDKDRLHRETKNIMRDFIQQHKKPV